MTRSDLNIGREMARLRTFATNLGLKVLAVAIILGAVEAALAITKFNTPDTLRYIQGKGVTHIPHAYYRHTKEGFSEGYYNSHGFRDYERTLEKPPGVFRILVLGDSYTEALQVQLEESFTALLEKALNEQPSDTRFEVLSLGHGGFGTAEELVRYLNFGRAFNPDLVVVAFTTRNDFLDNSKFLSREAAGFYYAFDHNRKLVLDRSLIDAYDRSLTFPKRIFQELKTKSHLLALISERIYLLRRQLLETRTEEAYGDAQSAVDEKPKGLSLFSDLNIYRRDLPPPWKEAVEITKEILLEFKRSVEEQGDRFLLVGLSGAPQVHHQLGNRLKNQYRIEFDYEQPDGILEEFARENGVWFLKLMPTFRDYHLKTGVYLHGFGGPSEEGHWNQAGHRLAAEEIYKFLKENRLVPVHGGK